MVFCATSAFATHVAVLETGADGAAKDKVPLSDRQYLTNVLREEAVKQLPATENYTIMTRENIQQMLPPGKAIEECEGSCLVETGKNISADYICQARVGSFDGDLTLSAELYETAGNKLIASFNGHGTNLKELLALIEQKSPDFFKVIKRMETPVPVAVEPVPEPVAPAPEPVVEDTAETAEPEEPEASQDTVVANAATADDSIRVNAAKAYNELDEKSGSQMGESIPANVEDDSHKSGVHWVPLSISAVALVAGTVLAVVGNNLAKDASEKDYSTASEYEGYLDDAKSGQTLRTVGIGIAIAGAVGIGLSFAF
ncbi:hypothetical protein [uncultured Fibrobacter sp.]|uniref:hypothetical protein n=1 Tax=uncultured Fibrobacter sp. TaxID=261512 RepID=UPI002614DD0B|nr:hypothetical protein [uncultured Fibrobacter sp.]